MLKRLFTVLSFVLIATYTLSPYVPVMAQDEQPPAGDTGLLRGQRTCQRNQNQPESQLRESLRHIVIYS